MNLQNMADGDLVDDCAVHSVRLSTRKINAAVKQKKCGRSL